MKDKEGSPHIETKNLEYLYQWNKFTSKAYIQFNIELILF